VRKNKEVEVNDSNFQKKVIKASNKIPIVVDFWAEWCGPCHMLEMTMNKLMKGYKGKFVLAKLNVDKNPKTAAEYRIMGIPNVKMFKNGQLADEFVGALPEIQVREWLDKNL